MKRCEALILILRCSLVLTIYAIWITLTEEL